MIYPDEKLYVLVREDLSRGQQAVQGMHALADFASQHPEHFHPWNRSGNTLVLLNVADNNHLLDCKALFVGSGMACVMFREPDMGHQGTALAIQPHPAVSEWVSLLPLALRAKKRWWRR